MGDTLLGIEYCCLVSGTTATDSTRRKRSRREAIRWFGAAITDIGDSSWSEFQSESLQLVKTFKARSKRVQQASVQPSQMQAPPMQPSSMLPADQERADYNTARRLQTLNYSSNPGGYLPMIFCL